LVLTTESEKVQLRRSPEVTPDVSGYRVPCEERKVALFQSFYPNSGVRMTFESVAENFTQRGQRESKSLRMERGLPHSGSQRDIKRLPLRRKKSSVSISVSIAKVFIKPTLKNTVHEGERGMLAILITKIPCRGRTKGGRCSGGINSRKRSDEENIIIDIFVYIFRTGCKRASSISVCKMIAPHFPGL